MTTTPIADRSYADAHQQLQDLRRALDRVIVGQQELVNHLITAVFAGGHVLIEGLPGLGKTHLAKALAAALGLHWARVQCTPDLMPADVTGAEIYATTAGGASKFGRRKTPRSPGGITIAWSWLRAKPVSHLASAVTPLAILSLVLRATTTTVFSCFFVPSGSSQARTASTSTAFVAAGLPVSAGVVGSLLGSSLPHPAAVTAIAASSASAPPRVAPMH